MSTKKKQSKSGSVLVTKDGKEFQIVGETSRYYICTDTQFKKNSTQIKEIKAQRQKAIYIEDDHKESGLLEEE